MHELTCTVWISNINRFPNLAQVSVDPPLHLKVEYGSDVEDLVALKREIEEMLRDKLIFTANVELLPPETLPRYKMKAQLIRKMYEQGR